MSRGCWDNVYAVILQYQSCANIISVCRLESVNQPETQQTIGMVFGDDECTHLEKLNLNNSYNCLPLPLQAAEEEQHSLYEI